mmetsp:Transcript_32163/g.44082  ORF Transcript_32163/g.44082 Transcript_32163/m.44082 type:complete len:672 (+) Transcript_32163:198-2213(+)|eukprot:CAMPEP_0201484604 /NCGR_PEP_ID=MMETSP0151_2-20130828/8766_1 /ASSEMBLY_ACC=CAM_ASM_000257 /TAXON_ID=200890 /ORGANISM="Paramoeba atlantica, Strain 621/1 / CCAP 1560/9" /LENGTH=671 /DNA_ID=CAMNT_0047868343 /DNA_START=194 /DNA_END=2209 /DNA_ORIENTATION=-
MKFGNYLKEFSVEKWRLYYVNYQYLKSVVKGFKKSSLPVDALERSFMAAIDEEVIKVNNFFMVTSQQLSAKFDSFIKLVSHENFYVSSPEILQEEIDGFTAELVDLDRYTKVNFEAFRKILKKYDRHTGHQALPWFMQRLKEQPFHINSQQFSSLILKFSKCCAGCRRILGEGMEASMGEEGHVSTVFRESLKFFVKLIDVMSVKTHIARHLPIFIYNPASGGKEAKESSSLWSCYYDQPASFSLYAGRLQNSQDSCTLRFRIFDQSKTVYIEKKVIYGDGRKRHSVQDMIDLPSHQIFPFIQGSFGAKQYKAHLTERGISIQEQERLLIIFEDLQKLIKDKGLRPSLSSCYRRTSFQIPGNKRIKAAIDEDLEFIKDSLSFSKEPPRWHMKRDQVGAKDVHELGFATVEITLRLKRGEERPQWLERLLASPWVTEASGFSKFLHGTAMLHKQVEHIGLPPWSDLFIPKDPKKEKEIEKEEEEPPSPIVEGGHFNIQFLDEHNEESSLLLREGDRRQERSRDSRGAWQRFQSFFIPPNHPLALEPAADLKVEPKTFFANERTFIQWASFCVVIQTIGIAFVGFSGSDKDTDKSKDGVAKVGGECYLIIAFCFLLYSLYNYRCRAARIRAQQHGNYDDFYGPFFLVVALSIACILNLIISFSSGDKDTPTDV